MLAAIHDTGAVALFITSGGLGFTALVVALYLAHEARRPVDAVDDECSRVDIEIDRGQGWRA